MEKKLPKIYVNRIDKDINNNDKVAYSKNDQFREVKEEVKEEAKEEARKQLEAILKQAEANAQ